MDEVGYWKSRNLLSVISFLQRSRLRFAFDVSFWNDKELEASNVTEEDSVLVVRLSGRYLKLRADTLLQAILEYSICFYISRTTYSD